MSLVSIPPNPVPEHVVTGMLETPDRVALRFARWAPPVNRKGTVCIFPGRTEFIEKYFETVRDLRARGFAVAILDWRGQGGSQRRLSDPLKGHVRNFSEFDIDLETFMQQVVLPDCPPPVFALGHSMGGLVLIRAAQRGVRWFERMVLCAPMLALQGLGHVGAIRVLTRTMRLLGMGRRYIPGHHTTLQIGAPFVGNPLTSDPVRYARSAAVLEAEPSLAIAAPTVAWLDAALRAMKDAAEPRYTADMRQPMLLIGAGHDTVVSTAAIEQFATRLRVGSHLIVPGAKHEMLMEQDLVRNQFLAAFDAFVPGSRY